MFELLPSMATDPIPSEDLVEWDWWWDHPRNSVDQWDQLDRSGRTAWSKQDGCRNFLWEWLFWWNFSWAYFCWACAMWLSMWTFPENDYSLWRYMNFFWEWLFILLMKRWFSSHEEKHYWSDCSAGVVWSQLTTFETNWSCMVTYETVSHGRLSFLDSENLLCKHFAVLVLLRLSILV